MKIQYNNNLVQNQMESNEITLKIDRSEMNSIDLSEIKESEITLNRGDTGLGFNIRGGVDNPHIPGDTGVFVTKIRENGAAHKDGRLKEGDKILSINGNSLVGVTHEEAVHLFTQAKETVTVKVQHGAQAAILKRKLKEKEAIEEQSKSPPSSSWSYLLYFTGAVGFCVAGYFIYKKYAR